MKWLLLLLPALAWSQSASNTQAVISYVCSGTSTVVVSASSSTTSGLLNAPVDDTNTALFAGSTSGTRAGTSVDPNNANLHYFPAGTRHTELALDSTYHSRALPANTQMFYQVTCSGTPGPVTSFNTSNIPSDETHIDPPEASAGGAPLIPTVADTRNIDIIDPQTGAVIRNIALTADGTQPNLYSGDPLHMCSSTMVGPGPGWLCNFPTAAGGSASVYYVIPSTREARFLGQMQITSHGPWPSCGASGVAAAMWDDTDPATIYTTTSYYISGSCGSELKYAVVIKGVYSGTYAPATPGSSLPITWTLLTTSPNFLPQLVNAFDSTFDITKFACATFIQVGQYAALECRRNDQSSYMWAAVLDMGDRLPLGSCVTCMHVIAATPTYSNIVTRWTVQHNTSNLGANNLLFISAALAEGNGLGKGPWASQLTQNITSSTTTFTVSGEPQSLTDLTVEPFLQNAIVGDVIAFTGSGSHYAFNSVELATITAKGAGTWTVARNTPPAPFGAVSHSTGENMTMVGGRAPDAKQHPIWWDFLIAPHGETVGYIREDSNDFTDAHADYFVQTPNVQVAEAYHYRQGAFRSNINKNPNSRLEPDPTFNGAKPFADGEAYTRYPVADKPLASANDQNWMLDQPGFWGGDPFSAPTGAVLVAGKTQIYKYILCTASGVPSGCGNAAPLHRKHLSTLAVSGGSVLTDVSGPSSVIADGSPGAATYCVPHIAGECVAGSVVGDVYFNITGLANTQCTVQQHGVGANKDICILDMSVSGNDLEQFSFIPSITGYGKRLSSTLTGPRPDGALAKSTPDGGLIFFQPRTDRLFMLTNLPFQSKRDMYDRSSYILQNIPLPPTGLSLPGSTATVDVTFGYAENGGKCTTRNEDCKSVTSGYVPNVPFSFATTDTYTRLPCAGGCTVTVPALSSRTLYATANYYDGGGTLLRSDVLPPAIVAPAGFDPPPGCAILPTSVPSGTVGTGYSQTFLASNCGTNTLTWTITGGSLPAGLSGCASTTGTSCVASGTPTVAGTYPFTANVTDGGSFSASQPYSLVISSGFVTTGSSQIRGGSMLRGIGR